MNGGSLYDLQKILGHGDIRATQIYAHLSQDHLREKMNLIQFWQKSPIETAKILQFTK